MNYGKIKIESCKAHTRDMLAEIRCFKFICDGNLDHLEEAMKNNSPDLGYLVGKAIKDIMAVQEGDPYELDKIEIQLASKFSGIDLTKAVCAAYFDLVRKEIEKNESIIRL